MIVQSNGKKVEELNKNSVSPRVLELRKKIRDNDYVDGAIQRIAQVISNRLVDNSVRTYIRG